MSDKKSELKRDSTMKVTAKEGIKLLKDAGEHTLLEMQGLDTDEEADSLSTSNSKGNATDNKKQRMQRVSTMAATAKEGRQFLQDQQKKKAQQQEPPPRVTKSKPKLSKFTTMLQTAQEGEAFLASKEKDKEQEKEEDAKTNDEPAAKKPKVSNKKPTTKRISTIIKTAKEGEQLLQELGHKDENPDSERRTTRSQTRGDPQPLPIQAPQKNAKETKDDATNKTGRRGRPRKEKPVANEKEGKGSTKAPLVGDKDDEDEEKGSGKNDGEDAAKEVTGANSEEEEEGESDGDKTNGAKAAAAPKETSCGTL